MSVPRYKDAMLYPSFWKMGFDRATSRMKREETIVLCHQFVALIEIRITIYNNYFNYFNQLRVASSIKQTHKTLGTVCMVGIGGQCAPIGIDKCRGVGGHGRQSQDFVLRSIQSAYIFYSPVVLDIPVCLILCHPRDLHGESMFQDV